MKLFFIATLAACITVVNAGETVKQITHKESSLDQYVTSASELSDQRAYVTYMSLNDASKNLKFSSTIGQDNLAEFRVNSAKAEKTIRDYRINVCRNIVNSDKPLAENTTYIFNANNGYDNFKAQQYRVALQGLDSELLNSVDSFQSTNVEFLTPQFIVDNIGQEWIDIKKQECYKFIMDNGVES